MAGTVENIVIEPCNVTWGDLDLGFTDGDIEISPEEQSVEVTAHQEGTNRLDALRTGKTLSLSVTMKEANVTKLTEILKAGGAVMTPQAEITSITCLADSAGSLNSKYFLINTALDAIGYYVWINVNNAGVDPAISGRTGVEVDVATGATASAVATAVAAALDALAGFAASSSGAVVTCTNATSGPTTDASAGNSGFTIAVTQQGYTDIVGWGNSKNFTSMLADSKKLVLHPSRLEDDDYDSDFVIWKAYPRLESIVHSGENPKMATVTFDAFLDRTRPKEIQLFAIGDHR